MKTLTSTALGAVVLASLLAGCGQKVPQAPAKPQADQNSMKAEMPDPTKPHPMPNGAHVVTDFSGLKKADQTVGDLFAGKAALAGKPVAVRGKVVKINHNVMGKNWVHLRDGTGEPGKDDLTVTTTGDLAVVEGDTVLAKGKLSTDKDLGMGYKYEVLLEDATVTKE